MSEALNDAALKQLFVDARTFNKFQPRPVDSTPDGPDRDVQDVRDLLVFQTFNVLQHQHHPVLG